MSADASVSPDLVLGGRRARARARAVAKEACCSTRLDDESLVLCVCPSFSFFLFFFFFCRRRRLRPRKQPASNVRWKGRPFFFFLPSFSLPAPLPVSPSLSVAAHYCKHARAVIRLGAEPHQTINCSLPTCEVPHRPSLPRYLLGLSRPGGAQIGIKQGSCAILSQRVPSAR
jgi:hypothetical protein